MSDRSIGVDILIHENAAMRGRDTLQAGGRTNGSGINRVGC